MDYVKVFEIVLVCVGAASMLAAALAPLTETKLDDKLAGYLSKAKKALDVLSLNTKKK